MRKLVFSTVLPVALAMAGAACGDGYGGGDDSNGGTSSTATAASESRQAGSAAKPSRTTTVKVMRTRYGRILVDGNGRALYLFTKEGGPRAQCYGACADAWPVFYARGRLRAGAGADADLIGTTRRRDGRRQVTYKGHALYYYVTDRAPGQVTCQNVVEFGGTWLVVSPAGVAIRG
jgi:predicted lipoprotein with Yx(FWY)xxD motif